MSTPEKVEITTQFEIIINEAWHYTFELVAESRPESLKATREWFTECVTEATEHMDDKDLVLYDLRSQISVRVLQDGAWHGPFSKGSKGESVLTAGELKELAEQGILLPIRA